MPTVFNKKAREMIGATVHKVLDAPLPNSPHSPGPAQMLGDGGSLSFPLLMGITKELIAASFEDWGTIAGAAGQGGLSCGEIEIVSGSCPEDNADAFEGSADHVLEPKDEKTGLQAVKTVSAINPGCVGLDDGVPVIIGKQLNGTWVIIWAMCPCIDPPVAPDPPT